MKHLSLRKLAALLMALAMLIGCASAESAFTANLQQKLNTTDLTRNRLVLTVPNAPQADQTLEISLQSKEGLVTLLATVEEQVVAELQSDGRTIWFGAANQVFALPVSELEQLIRDLPLLNPLYAIASSPTAQQQLGQLFLMLIQNVFGQSIATKQDENGNMVITVDLTGRQILDGVAATLETFAGQYSFSKEDPNLTRFYGIVYKALVGAGALSGAPATLEEAATQIWAMLGQQAGQLRNLELDLTIKGEIVVGRTDANFAFAVTTRGQTVHIDGTAATANYGRDLAFTMKVYDDQNEYVTVNASIRNLRGETLIEAKLNTSYEEYRLSGAFSEESGRLDVDTYYRERLYASNTFMYAVTDSGVEFVYTSNSGDNVNLFISEGKVAARGLLRVQGAQARFSFSLTEDALGRHPWSFSVMDMRRYNTTGAEWDGQTLKIISNENVVTLTGREVSETQYAFDAKNTNLRGEVMNEATLMFSLSDIPETGWELTVDVEENGECRNVCDLASTDQIDVPTLADKVTQELNEEIIINELVKLLVNMSGARRYAY